MTGPLPLIRLLESFCLRRDRIEPPTLDAGTVDWLIRTGCGPVAWNSWQKQLQDDPHAHKLRAADLTARILHAEFIAHVAELLGVLSDERVDVVPLKGLSAAHRYYPESHLRIMGDVDLLLRREQIQPAVALLEKLGFQSHPELRKAGYDTHHHVAPLHNPRWEVWVELHHDVLKPDFVAARDAPFREPWSTDELREGRLQGHSVYWLSREFELAYIAAGLCLDLAEGFANERVQRNIIDAMLILNMTDRRIDDARLLAWAAGSATGGCLLVLLAYLQRHALIERAELVRELARRQAFVDMRTCGVFARLLDRYVASDRRPGWAARRSLPAISKRLIQRRPPWRNRVAASLAVLRP